MCASLGFDVFDGRFLRRCCLSAVHTIRTMLSSFIPSIFAEYRSLLASHHRKRRPIAAPLRGTFALSLKPKDSSRSPLTVKSSTSIIVITPLSPHILIIAIVVVAAGNLGLEIILIKGISRLQCPLSWCFRALDFPLLG